ncbi:MAG: hypothetical protein ACRD5D_03600 [Candidatus Polarisedimenticolia bacterium]
MRRLPAAVLLFLLVAPPAGAIHRDALKESRHRFEGLSFRLRVDLKSAAQAVIPNVVSLDGVGYGSERAPILFSRLETVYLERVTGEGGRRVSLTIYRSREEADQLRASAIPQPMMSNPNLGGTLAAFARQGSTTVVLELRADKKDGPGQIAEIETLIDRLFYRAEPPREELEAFVRAHPDLPISRLQALTGLDPAAIRALREEGRDGGAGPR